jgi:tRNA dimethylallyltransferase
MECARENQLPVIAIVGPTASGKSDAAVALARDIKKNAKRLGVNGAEIVSADSRQVYKGFNLTSGKITRKEMRGVPHHMLDVASPRRTFTVSHYQKLGRKAIQKIFSKNKIPIICGGTGFFVDALLYDIHFPPAKPNRALRAKLEKYSVHKLFFKLQRKDPRRAATIDPHNKRRLIRALEIVAATGKPVPPETRQPYYARTIIVGITLPKSALMQRIEKRVIVRIRRGMIAEVTRLHAHGLSWKRLEQFGLEYRWIARYLQKKITKDEMIASLTRDIKHYAKRQITWFKKDPTIIHITSPLVTFKKIFKHKTLLCT